MKQLLSGNEAVARGAWEAGIRVAAGYPGTPSTEILETLAPMPGVYAEWCPNEKVALDVAIGAAYAGARSMAVMKHVGLNVAADSLFYVAVTGLEAGLVIVVADDPGLHSSQGEQDTRRFAKFARVPCLEPSDSQEAKEMVPLALALSEEYDTPVLLRLTTRIAHSHSIVALGRDRSATAPGEAPSYRVDAAKYVMAPANARRRRPIMEERVRRLAERAEALYVNRLEWRDRSLGIVTNGAAYQYVREVLPDASVLRLGLTYPLPAEMVRDFARQVGRLVVVEELDPVVEEEIRLLGIACEGKSIFPLIGELSPDAVRSAAVATGLLAPEALPERLTLDLPALPPRPPLLCPGCPHRGIFAVARKLRLVVNGDIGCYTLGYLPPLGALHTTGCMGASIGQAHGVGKAGVREQNVAIIGDSTFFHSGIPALLNVAYNRSNTVTIIVDNRTTAMTGHQPNPGTGITLQQQETGAVELEPLVRALGIERVVTVDPYDLAAVEAALRAGLTAGEPAVVISRRACALLPEQRRAYHALAVDADKCLACGACRRLGCPALVKSDLVHARTGRPKTAIDPLLCTGCGICAQVCSAAAIARPVLESEEVV